MNASVYTYVFGIINDIEEGDPISATNLLNSVWLKCFDSQNNVGIKFFISKGPGPSWEYIDQNDAKVLAAKITELGGNEYSIFQLFNENILSTYTAPISCENIKQSSVLFYSDDEGCDETEYDESYQGAMIVYRTQDTMEIELPELKSGDLYDLAGFINDPINESVVIVKS